MRTLSDWLWIARAMACPCCGPKISVLRISRSSVPCRWAAYSRSARFRIDIRPEYAYARVECQPVASLRGRPETHMSMFSRRRASGDFADEIEAHLALETERLVREGLPPDEARFAARRAFGNMTAAQERHYESHRLMWLDHLRQDARGAARSVMRYPVAALVAIVSLAAGIGATTATLTIRNVVFRRPPPAYSQPEDLSKVQIGRPDRPIMPIGGYTAGRLSAVWHDALVPASAAATSAGRTKDVR